MFERELETLEKIIKDNTIGNAESISLQSILESNIPIGVKSFFRGEIAWFLFQERRQETRQTRFNYSHDDVKLLQEQTDFLLIQHYRFDQKTFAETSDKAVHFLFNYLCRPIWTLENFLFDEKNVLTIDELRAKFRYCSDYSYYWTIVEKYLTTKMRTDLSKEEAVELLRKIDKEIIRDNNALALGRMTEPFFTFVQSIQKQMTSGENSGIPTKALSYFFEDKGIKSVAEHLSRLRDNGKAAMHYEELLTILNTAFVKKGWYVEKESLPLSKNDPALAGASSLLIPEREKLTVIKTLFSNNESAFNETIGKILSSPSWEEASLSLDHYFTMNDIEPYSREAIVLTNALQSYFSNLHSER